MEAVVVEALPGPFVGPFFGGFFGLLKACGLEGLLALG